jgi:hypothetical protein
MMESFKRKLLKDLPGELNQYIFALIPTELKISFVTRLLNRVHDKCAICKDIKRLEYLAIDDKGDLYDICENCEKKLEECVPCDARRAVPSVL